MAWSWHFTDEALRAIARQAMTRNTGARGLRTIIEEIMLDIMYEIPFAGRHPALPDDRGAVLRRTGPDPADGTSDVPDGRSGETRILNGLGLPQSTLQLDHR